MVLALESVALLEDRHQLAGQVLAVVDKDYDGAQQMFLRGQDQFAALQMRKDLKHWSAAMRIAEQFDPEDMANIMTQHAATLEMQGDPAGALRFFKVCSFPCHLGAFKLSSLDVLRSMRWTYTN
jgi:WD repeat-containing protein 19